jgi:hypothetical protein
MRASPDGVRAPTCHGYQGNSYADASFYFLDASTPCEANVPKVRYSNVA